MPRARPGSLRIHNATNERQQLSRGKDPLAQFSTNLNLGGKSDAMHFTCASGPGRPGGAGGPAAARAVVPAGCVPVARVSQEGNDFSSPAGACPGPRRSKAPPEGAGRPRAGARRAAAVVRGHGRRGCGPARVDPAARRAGSGLHVGPWTRTGFRVGPGPTPAGFRCGRKRWKAV